MQPRRPVLVPSYGRICRAVSDSGACCSSLIPSEIPFHALGERHSVNNEDGIIIVDQINHLQIPASFCLAVNHFLFIANWPRKRSLRPPHHVFRFLWLNTVLLALFDVPADPAEFHN
jgi:hypothetical protein